MTRIYISDQGNDRNDGLSKETPIYSWTRARKLFAGHLEINVDSPTTRRRLMEELDGRRGRRACLFRAPQAQTQSAGGGLAAAVRLACNRPAVKRAEGRLTAMLPARRSRTY
jgi:hypothetical protein